MFWGARAEHVFGILKKQNRFCHARRYRFFGHVEISATWHGRLVRDCSTDNLVCGGVTWHGRLAREAHGRDGHATLRLHSKVVAVFADILFEFIISFHG